MLQRILSNMRKAIEDYEMIQEGDHIGVGVSGGKDSLVLLLALKELQRFLPVKFSITAITLSMGFEGFHAEPLIQFYKKLDIPWHIEETGIGDIVFKTRKETNPCALCSNMKKGVLYAVAKDLGCNKVAFGHHCDDAIATLLMSLVYEGRIHCFSPVTHLSRVNLTLIRPMIYVEERQVITCAKQEDLHIVKSGCPADGLTKRSVAKNLIGSLKSENPRIEATLFGAIQRSHINGWKPMGKSSQYKKGHKSEQTNNTTIHSLTNIIQNDSKLQNQIHPYLKNQPFLQDEAKLQDQPPLQNQVPLQAQIQDATTEILMQLLHPTDIGQSYTNVLRIAGTFIGADRCSLLTYQQDGSMRMRQLWKNDWVLAGEDNKIAPYPDPSIMNTFGLYMNCDTRKDSSSSDFIFPMDQLHNKHYYWVAQTIQVNKKTVALAFFECIQTPDIPCERLQVLDVFQLLMNKAHERRFLELAQNIEMLNLQDAFERKNAFFANMSHELRNPMNAVIGYINLLETTKLSDAQKQLIYETKNASDLLLMLVNDVLDYSKIEAGQIKMESIPFSLASCIENAVSLNAAQAQNKNIDLGILIDPTLPETLIGDPTRIKQILSNIVSNAVKFTAHGFILVEVFAKEQTYSNEKNTLSNTTYFHSFAEDFFTYLRSDIIPGQVQMLEESPIPRKKKLPPNRIELTFRISDTGIGMSSETLKNLYQPYQQAEASTFRNYGGTGLGMAITQKLIDLMDGDISVISREGSGSSFVCHIPFTIETNSNAVIDKGLTGRIFKVEDSVHTDGNLVIETQSNITGTDSDKAEAKLKILIIEPSLLQAQIAIQYVRYNHFDYTYAQTAAKALSYITSGQLFHMILISDMLQDNDMSSLINIMRNMPTTEQTPIILMKNIKNIYTDHTFLHNIPLQSITRPLKYNELLQCIVTSFQETPSLIHKEIPKAGLTSKNIADSVENNSKGNLHLSKKKPTHQKASILVIEDNIVNQTVFDNMLRVYGLTCEIAENGKEAFELFEKNHYDILFMDCQMPVMDGFAATIKIRELQKPQPVIVALTGSNTPEQRAHCLSCGMDDFLVKPIDMDTLFKWLDKILNELGFDHEEMIGWPAEHSAGKSSQHLMTSLGLTRREANQLIKLFLVELDGLLIYNPYTKNSTHKHLPSFSEQNETKQIEFQQIKELAHKLRGSAGSIKLNDFYEQLTVLESAAEKQDFNQTTRCLVNIENLKEQY